jgi:hypothetical protein
MIKDIISLLKTVNNETENIRIAKGKNKLATSWSEAFKQIKDSYNGNN